MTEEEAKEKKCPYQELADTIWVVKGGGFLEHQKIGKCCASECMWWGWMENKPECEHGRCEAPGGAA